ncbi:MAG: class I SAM-dependent methyltransferase [Bryobacteraceae bacterium]|jgi:SAM-dependent methyltransferase
MGLIDQMREDWNRRARQDAYYYAAFGRQNQDDREFFASAADVVPTLERELVRLPEPPGAARRALEIGCGPGRLMLPMSRYFIEIHGVDISEEMAAVARQRLREIPHAHVHVTSGDGLEAFADGFFDFVYSYIVFQHIPDPDIVLRYLGEARRVLKNGGILCCQLRGAPPLPSEMRREAPTWTGCFFTGEQMVRFARENNFHLVALSGLETQYMWTTWLKPAPAGAVESASRPDLSRVTLKAVTAASGGEARAPARGPDAAVSLWIDGLPSRGHLGNLEAAFHHTRARGCYISPITESGGCQLNVRLPEGLSPGLTPVALYFEGRALGEPKTIEIAPPPPRAPRIVSVSDGLNIASKYRIEMGGVKVTVEDVERPEDVLFTVDGRPAEYLQFERKDPITSTFEFAFHLSRHTRLGTRTLAVRASGLDLTPVSIEIAGLRERHAAPKSGARQTQNG